MGRRLKKDKPFNYDPRGVCEVALYCRDPEFLFEGPAGTGKSRALLERMHLLAIKYPGMRGLICRKTRTSLTESGLVTFERFVVDRNSTVLEGPRRSGRRAYRYLNGSEIVIGGMDKPSKILSTEFDAVYVQEATELSEEDWETLCTRLRAGVMPYQQIFADCNPDRPLHWLNQRCLSGKTRRFLGRHEENPNLWDHSLKDWTEVGREYIKKLDALTGTRKERLRYGRWVAAEGVIFDGFDAATHVLESFPIPTDWRRIWVIDFGFTNPFVWQDWAIDSDNRAYLVREIYRTQRTVAEHCQLIRTLARGWPAPEAVVCDHDAEGRATLEQELGVSTIRATKTVSDGIQLVQERLKSAEDGKARMFVLKDALIERDTSLADLGKPTCSLDEVDGYIWRKDADEPLKENDHGMDCWRYLCAYLDKDRKPKMAKSYRGSD